VDPSLCGRMKLLLHGFVAAVKSRLNKLCARRTRQTSPVLNARFGAESERERGNLLDGPRRFIGLTIFEALAARSPQSLHLVDSSIVRAHQHAAGAKKRARITPLAVLVAD
jgi:hypothetical protein